MSWEQSAGSLAASIVGIVARMSDLPVLDRVEQRIVGSLLEKQVTVPASYPLTLKSLRAACNQASSREPVTSYGEPEVEAAARGLKQRGLLRIVWADTGRRTLKYHQTLDEVLDLEPGERALLTVLLLRGPQAPGELRSRCDRLHVFSDVEAVAATLHALAGRDEPLVSELERQPGQHQQRWVHQLGPVEVTESPVAPATPSETTTLSTSPEQRDEQVRATYDQVATTYAEHVLSELDDKPFDRWLLGRVVDLAEGGPIADVGCGPGHTTRFLADRGGLVTGSDVSEGMVAEARQRFPGLTFEQADLRSLVRPPAESGWAAVVAWYALVHLSGSELDRAVGALARPLRPGGWLALGVHVGDEVRHATEWWGHEVDLDFVLHDADRVRSAVEHAGLQDVEWYLRGPYLGGEVDTERLYVLGRTAQTS